MGNFMQPKHWKLIAAVALLVGAGAVYMVYGRADGALPERVRFICVETGQTFQYSRANMPTIIPAKNPGTGAETLLPVIKHEDGKWYVDRHYGFGLSDEEGLAKVNKYVDPETLEVLSAPR
jgi:hypothetical protein